MEKARIPLHSPAGLHRVRSVNLPNAITLFRLVLTAIFVAVAALESRTAYGVALVAFSLAAISDYLDGYLARRLNLVTSLGKLLDPLADKILVCAGFVFLSAEGLAPVWVTSLILTREFLVTGIRQIAVEQGHVMAADRLGKWKTTFQLTFCITALVYLSFPIGTFFHRLASPGGVYLLETSMWLAVLFTAVSGWNYFWKNRAMFDWR